MKPKKPGSIRRLRKSRRKRLGRSIELATSLLVVILNIAEIIFIAKTKRKKKIYEIILASLSLSDCLFGLSNAIICSIKLSKSWNSRNDLIAAVYTAYVFFALASIFHLIFIAVDRVMIVLIPFQYETIFTKKRLKIGIALLWILAFGISISTYVCYEVTVSENKINVSKIQNNTSIFLKPKKNKFYFKINRSMKQSFQKDMELVLSISIVVTDLIMTLCYSTIIYQINYKTRNCETVKRKKEKGLPLLCMFIAGVFFIFTLPFAITRLHLRNVPSWATCSMILNSGMNSVVYFFRGRLESYQTRDS